MVSPSQGVHVVVERDFLGGEHALLVPKTRDGRVLFAVPWLGKLILGTTDTPRQDLAREPEPFEDELAFILDEASRVLARPVRRSDIRSLWVGLRPLVAPPSEGSGATQALSREHTVVIDPNGLVTVTGGKWTTYRAMAEDVLQRIGNTSRLFSTTFCRTESDVTQMLTASGLANVDGVFFANTTGNIGIPDLNGYEGDIAPSLLIAKAYSAEAFATLMRTGRTLAGTDSATGLMSSTARWRFAHFTDEEIGALKAYLDLRE